MALNIVEGRRMWDIVSVNATCPHCWFEIEIPTSKLTDNEIWNGKSIQHTCENCHKAFKIIVAYDYR